MSFFWFRRVLLQRFQIVTKVLEGSKNYQDNSRNFTKFQGLVQASSKYASRVWSVGEIPVVERFRGGYQCSKGWFHQSKACNNKYLLKPCSRCPWSFYRGGQVKFVSRFLQGDSNEIIVLQQDAIMNHDCVDLCRHNELKGPKVRVQQRCLKGRFLW